MNDYITETVTEDGEVNCSTMFGVWFIGRDPVQLAFLRRSSGGGGGKGKSSSCPETEFSQNSYAIKTYIHQ